MQALYEQIRLNKPNIRESSLTVYVNSIMNLYKKINGKYPKDIDAVYKQFLTEGGVDKVIEVIRSRPANTRKSILANILSLCRDKDDNDICIRYRQMMDSDIEVYERHIASNQKTERQKANWIGWDIVINVYDDMKKSIQALKLTTNKELTKRQYNQLQSFVLLSMYVLIAPRRIQDMIYLKFVPDDENNYVDFKKNQLVFNKYKTSKYYKEQVVDLPKPLKTILQKWQRTKQANNINDNDFVFTRYGGQRYEQPDVTNLLLSIFKDNKHTKGKNISVNILRHSYITSNVLPDIQKMKETAKDMGHDITQQLQYAKV